MEVVEFVKSNNYLCVKGNHEEMMVREANSKYYGTIWTDNGGLQTMHSYHTPCLEDEEYSHPKLGINVDFVFHEHIEWLSNLPIFLEFEDIKNDKGEHLLVTHSSANRVWKWSPEMRAQRKVDFEEHLMWEHPLGHIDPIKGIYNIHGHSPRKGGPKITQIYANIDTGACFRESGYGVLTALQFPEMIVYEQKNID